MNLQIFYEKSYYEKLDTFLPIYECNPVFPFEDFGIDPNNLVQGIYDATDVYIFLKKVHFIYYFEQRYIGLVNIDGNDYIIQVDDEVNIYIIGNNEVNWLRLFLTDIEYLSLTEFFSIKYNIKFTEPDYDYYLELQNKFITF